MLFNFKEFESVGADDNKKIVYNDQFLKEWETVTYLYNNYVEILENFYTSIENELHLYGCTGYTYDSDIDNLERSKVLKMKHALKLKLEKFIEQYKKAYIILEKYALSPSLAIRKDQNPISSIEHSKMINTPEYKIVQDYFYLVNKKYNFLEDSYLKFYDTINNILENNPNDALTIIENLIKVQKIQRSSTSYMVTNIENPPIKI